MIDENEGDLEVVWFILGLCHRNYIKSRIYRSASAFGDHLTIYLLF